MPRFQIFPWDGMISKIYPHFTYIYVTALLHALICYYTIVQQIAEVLQQGNCCSKPQYNYLLWFHHTGHSYRKPSYRPFIQAIHTGSLVLNNPIVVFEQLVSLLQDFCNHGCHVIFMYSSQQSTRTYISAPTTMAWNTI